jgi:acyl-CoA thioester hydrolase
MNDGSDQAALHPGYYKHWIEDQVRYADLDPVGHCNSAVYSTFFESARVALLEDCGMPQIGRPEAFAIVQQNIHYRRELRLGARIRIGTKVTKLGRTSVRLANAVFEGEVCAATAEIVGVVISMSARKALELPADLRERLAAYT